MLVIGMKKEKLSPFKDISPINFPNQLKLFLKNIDIIPIAIKRIPIKIKDFPMFILKFTNNIKYSMIPFTSTAKDFEKRCHFFHGNGYPPNAYKSFLNTISRRYNIQSMFLRQFWEDPPPALEVKNWDILLDDLAQYAEEHNIHNEYAIGHSIGGNLLLRSSLENRDLYQKIVLLDPTIFSPLVIYIWRILCYFKIHPLIKKAKNRRRIFNNFEEIFNSYRSKNTFSKIADDQLNEYIYSIFEKRENQVELSYDSIWEEVLYLTGGIKDFDIWRKLNDLQTPTLIIIPDNSPVLRYGASKKILKNDFVDIKVIKDSSHLFPLEKPNKTSQIILDFFS